MAKEDLRENPFRDEIYDYLRSSGYQSGQAADYDYKNALDTAKLLEFLELTQPEQLARFRSTHGNIYRERLLKLINSKIEGRGLLATLNEKVEDYTSGSSFSLAYFGTNLKAMTANQQLYQQNLFSVRREFNYEDKLHGHRVDLALFLNGIPLVMMELKKQTAGQKARFEGTNQFRYTRNPEELIFSFNRRTLIYFTIDEFEAFITTRLDQKETLFLPFNRGSEDEGAGNPTIPGHHNTCYLWEEILQPDMLLKIIREFIFIDDKGDMVFPRYHQLDAVLKVEADVKALGVGGRYLIWHSAGSGKTKTIGWLSRRLLNIPEINTVIVISDRLVIDDQLKTEIENMEVKKGVSQHPATSAQLSKLLDAGQHIIVTTLQKFPPILAELESKPNRNYAIIIDEAHSSAAGTTLSKTSETLSGKSLKDAIAIDTAYEDLEDGQELLLKQKSRITATKNVSYFAFTATPKTETMELFGTRKALGKSYYHKYSMKQAIEEGFILNPLTCYTTYNEKFELRKKKEDDTAYESRRATVAIMHHITSSEEVVKFKTDIIMDDFVLSRSKWLGGKAKAMIITPSRKHAVAYKLAVDRYIARMGYNFKAVVGFTGTIELDGVQYTEENMNSSFAESDLPTIIKNHDEVRIIVVADKLQTGFDEDKLCVLYVDKSLNSAVKAVQTLSRINRPAKEKKTFILDFVNDCETIKEYFSQYYGGEIYLPAENEIDPNWLFAKRDELLDYQVFTQAQAERAHDLIAAGEKHSGELTALFSEIKSQFNLLEERQQELFTQQLSRFVKLYYYISTVYSVWNPDLKRLVVFFAALYNVLHAHQLTTEINPDDLVELVAFSAEIALEEENLLMEVQDYTLDQVSTESVVKEKTLSLLDEIIERINTRYGYQESTSRVLHDIADTISNDEDMIVNVRDSYYNAYVAEALDRVEKKLADLIFKSVEEGRDEEAQLYADINNDLPLKTSLADLIIAHIESGLGRYS